MIWAQSPLAMACSRLSENRERFLLRPTPLRGSQYPQALRIGYWTSPSATVGLSPWTLHPKRGSQPMDNPGLRTAIFQRTAVFLGQALWPSGTANSSRAAYEIQAGRSAPFRFFFIPWMGLVGRLL